MATAKGAGRSRIVQHGHGLQNRAESGTHSLDVTITKANQDAHRQRGIRNKSQKPVIRGSEGQIVGYSAEVVWPGVISRIQTRSLKNAEQSTPNGFSNQNPAKLVTAGERSPSVLGASNPREEVSYGRQKQVRTSCLLLHRGERQQILQPVLSRRARNGGTSLQLRPLRLCRGTCPQGVNRS